MCRTSYKKSRCVTRANRNLARYPSSAQPLRSRRHHEVDSHSVGRRSGDGRRPGPGRLRRHDRRQPGDMGSAALIHTASMKVGDKTETVLKNKAGLTLYYFTPDTATAIACSGGCATTWPPLLADTGAPTSAATLPGRLSVTDGVNGKQVVYNGHPLYTY